MSTNTTTFEPALDVKNIKAHPANPRRKAIADDEMVASIKGQGLIQPIVVAPAAEGDGYVVIAGHRRLDGMKKARKRTTPAIVRTDLTSDAQQIEAAVVENVHRVDLSPMEEAEAFEQLRELKHTQRDISKMTGRPVSTIRDRLKLLKLSKKTRESVHTGQLTIGDALEIVAFEDDPKAQDVLVKAAGSPDFRWKLDAQKRLRERTALTNQIVDRLTTDGVRKYELKGARDVWTAERNDDELKSLSYYAEVTYEDRRKEHADCLAYALIPSYGGGHDVYLLCTAHSIHKEKISKADREAQRVAEERQAMWKAEAEQKAIAGKLRRQTVLDLVPEGAAIPDFLVDQLRVVLPPAALWIYGDLGDQPELFFETAGTADADRFRFGLWDDEEDAKQLAFIATFNDMPGWRLVRLLMVVLLELTEAQPEHDTVGDTVTSRYFGFLAELGHHFTEQDTEIRDRTKAHLAAQADETDDEAEEAAS
jgi:ParB family chromosome partitioning protein